MRLPLRWLLPVGAVLLVLGTLAGVLTLSTIWGRREARRTAQQSLEQSSDLVAQLLAGRGRSLAGGAQVFAQGPAFRTLVAEQRRDDILDQAFEAASQLDASWAFITDPSGRLIAKSDEPSAHGEPLGGVALVSGALRGQPTSGYGSSGDTALFQATGVPIAAPGGAVLGVLVATRLIDSVVASDVAHATNHQVLFFVRDSLGRTHVAATGGLDPADARETITHVEVALSNEAADRRGVSLRTNGVLLVRGQSWLWSQSSLTTTGGNAVGGFVVMRPDVEALAAMSPTYRALVVVGVFALVLAVVSGLQVSRWVGAPMANATRAIHEMLEHETHHWEHVTTRTSPSVLPEGDMLEQKVSELRRRDLDERTLRGMIAVAPDISSRLTEAGIRQLPRVTSVAGSALAGSADNVRIGDVLGRRYRLEAAIGHGDRSQVYRATDLSRDEEVALTLLRPEAMSRHFRLDVFRDAVGECRRRLGSSQEPHRHHVRVIDVGDIEGVPFVTMELVEGCTLTELIHRYRGMSAPAVGAIGRQLLRGLAAAHDRGVVHGDLKPDNILITNDGTLKVADFGLAQLIRRPPQVGRTYNQADTVSGHLSGARVGAPEYMAPELLIGAEPTDASDCYSAGLILRTCMQGVEPFAGSSPVELLGTKLQTTAVHRMELIQSAMARSIAHMTHADVALRARNAQHLLDTWHDMEETV